MPLSPLLLIPLIALVYGAVALMEFHRLCSEECPKD